MQERKIKVVCGDVSLQLTLSAKLLAKPFEDAVLRPFLKAYAKKTGEPADVARIARVEVDEEMLGDLSITASVVLLANETVEAAVFLRPLEVQEQMVANELSADPFAPLPEDPFAGGASTASGRTVHAPPPRDISQDKVQFEEDNLTPIERLKKERREAREARERLDEAAAAGAVLHDASTATPAPKADGDAASRPLAPGVRVRVEGLTSAAGSSMNGKEGDVVAWRADKERWEIRLDGATATVNVKSANLVALEARAAAAAAPPASDGGAAALRQLDETEGRIPFVDAALRELETGVADMTASNGAADTDGSFRAAARHMLSGHLATINKLLAGLDEVSLGEVSDAAACAAARARKKAAAAWLEGGLLPKARALQSQLEPPVAHSPPVPAPAKQSAEIDSDDDATAPSPPPAAPAKQSAEIDSDED